MYSTGYDGWKASGTLCRRNRRGRRLDGALLPLCQAYPARSYRQAERERAAV